MSNLKHFVVTLALIPALIPALAAAWTPYGYGPYQSAAPDQPPPGAYDRGPAAEFGPMGPTGPMDPGGPMGAPRPMAQAGGMRIQQSATEEAYLLDIQLSGLKPAEVKVEAKGPWVLVTRDTSAETSQEETFGDGRGYRRSFSYSSGRASRRFKVPGDGDTAAMQRQDAEDAIRITIPRTQAVMGPR